MADIRSDLSYRVGSTIRSTSTYKRWAERQAQKSRFTQEQAYYINYAATQVGRCANCPWFVEPSSCALVEGTILPGGVCGLFDAAPARITAYELAYGRGTGQHGVLPQVVRKRVEQVRASLSIKVP